MKRKLLALTLAALMALSLLPLSALADTGNLLTNPSFEAGMSGWVDPEGKWSAVESESGFRAVDGQFFAWPTEAASEDVLLYQDVPAAGLTGTATLEVYTGDVTGDGNQEELQFLDAAGGVIAAVSNEETSDGDWTLKSVSAPIPAGTAVIRVVFRAFHHGGVDVDGYFDNARLTVTGAAQSEPPAGEDKPWSNASTWALDELEKAIKKDLFPEVLVGKDLTQPITRAEFAAVAVKTYEALGSTKAAPAARNPFSDTNDPDVLKAFNVGAVNGMGDGTWFAPGALLNREQAAVMLTRAMKSAMIEGWTLEHDSEFKIAYAKPAPFADDADISDWARDSVYFMAARGIMKGVGDGRCFAPKNVTSSQQASNYASATREQSVIIAVRMVEALG